MKPCFDEKSKASPRYVAFGILGYNDEVNTIRNHHPLYTMSAIIDIRNFSQVSNVGGIQV